MITSQQSNKLLEEWKRHSGILDIQSVIEDLKNEDVHFKIPKISYLEDGSNPVTELHSIGANPIFLYYNLVKKEFFFKYKFAFKNRIVLEEPEEFVVGETIRLLEITDRRKISTSTFASTVTRKTYLSETTSVRGLYILKSDKEKETVVFNSKENPESYFDSKLDLELTKENLISLLEELVKILTITESEINYFEKTKCLSTHQPISYKFLSEEEKRIIYKRIVKGIFCLQGQFVTRVDYSKNFIQKISNHLLPETVTEELLTEIVSEIKERAESEKSLRDDAEETLRYIKSERYPNRFFPEGFEKVNRGIQFLLDNLETK